MGWRGRGWGEGGSDRSRSGVVERKRVLYRHIRPWARGPGENPLFIWDNIMGRVPRFRMFLNKADAAMLSAIEIYNKPDFAYREEAFAILALNAWELLLKGRALQDNGNNLRCLYVYERRRTKDGKWTKRRFVKRNRTGNAYTKGLMQIVNEFESDANRRLPIAIRNNLLALSEIRDNAVHFINPGSVIAKKVLEIGTASVKNYVELNARWFGRDLSRYKLYLMPIGFVGAPGTATGLPVSIEQDKLLACLAQLIAEGTTGDLGAFHVALDVDIAVKRSGGSAAAGKIRLTNDPSAPAMQVREEDILRTFPWDYAELTRRLRKRYKDFLQNQKYHDICRGLKDDERYVRTRFLTPGSTKGLKKDLYNPNIMRQFDKHYTRR